MPFLLYALPMDLPLHETPEYAAWVADVNTHIAEVNRRIRTAGGRIYFCEKTGEWLETKLAPPTVT